MAIITGGLVGAARAEVPPAKPLAELVAEVMTFLVSDVGEGGIRTNDDDPEGYPVPPYFYHYAIKDSNGLWSGGPGYPGYDAVSYPAYTASVGIDAFLDYRRWSGDPEMLERARAFADWILEHRTPATDLYGNLPYSTQTDAVMGGGWDGPAVMTDKPAMFALRLLRLYDITGEAAYWDGALEIADVLAATQLTGEPEDAGRWPFRVVPGDGTVTHDYTSHLQPAVRLFETLVERTNDLTYAATADRAWQWLLDNPCDPASAHYQRWEAFYEDQSPRMQIGSQDHYSAHEMIVELARRQPPGWPQTAVDILAHVTDLYLHEGPQPPYYPYEPVTLEWEGWPEATYAASFQYARTALVLNRALADHPLRDDVWRDRALAMIAVCTHGQNNRGIAADGRMFTTVRDLLVHFNIDSWYEQNFNTVKYGLEIMALVPELAPGNETHVLSADRALTAIEYDANGWAVVYATAGDAGREVVRMEQAPGDVRAGGVPLPEMDAPDLPEPGWHWDSDSQLLTVRHARSPVQVGLATTRTERPAGSATAGRLILETDAFYDRPVRLYQPLAGAASLEIFDLRGRRVRRLLDGADLTAGWHELRWDGRDRAGAPVASGVYLLRARSAAGRATARVLVAR